MDDVQLKELLASYNQQLEQAKVLNLQSWVLNYKCYESLQSQKAKHSLKSLINIKIFAVLLGILWILFLGYLLYYSLEMSKIFFVISVSAIILISLIAVVVYIHHIALIRSVSNSESVIKTQETIARLQTSTIRVTRILFLSAPFYCTFWWSPKMIVESPLSFWLISFPIAAIFSLAAVWLFKNISYKNAGKKWFRILFNSPEWTSLIKASIYLNEIENFKKDS